MEYLALIAEIESLKEEIALLRAHKNSKKPERLPCPGVTGKGEKCKKFCVEGGVTCKVHGRPVKEPQAKKPKAPKAPKAVKIACTGVNMRGNPCKNKCVENQTWCEKHNPSVPVKIKKSKGHKKVVHNHEVVIESLVPCEACDTGTKWVSEVEFWVARNEPRMI